MRHFTFSLTILLLAMAATSGQAQTTMVIRGATLVDGTGRPQINDAVIIIEGTRIRQVGTGGKTKIPSGAQVIDARGKFIIPGLADMHNHLGNGTFGPGQGPPDYKKNLAQLLAWGVTTIFAPGFPDVSAFAELKSLSADDAAPYPHFFGASRTVGAKGGHGGSQGAYTPETPDEARAAVRELKAGNVDGVKLFYDDMTYVVKKPWPKLKPEVMVAVIDEAHKQGLKAYVHVRILRYAKEVLRAGADVLVHGIVSDLVDDEFIALMKKNHAVYIANHTMAEAVADMAGWARRAAAFDDHGLIAKGVYEVGMNPATLEQWESRLDNLAYLREHLPVLRANTKRVNDAGILVVSGSDTGDAGAGVLLGLASQMEPMLLVEAGLTPQEAIKAATINAARMIGREKELGSIEPGKVADLMILDADPLADIRNIRRIYRVVKGGVIYDPEELLMHNRKVRVALGK